MSSIFKYFSLFVILFSPLIQADDTEMFFSDMSGTNNIRPQVLIIFDNSGSMLTSVKVPEEKFSADREYTKEKKIYWSTSGDSNLNPYRHLQAGSQNHCQSSLTPLKKFGQYTDNVRVAIVRGNKYSWAPLAWVYQTEIYDCKADQDDKNNTEYPINNKKSPYMKKNKKNKKNKKIFTSPDAVTLYTANYYYWYMNKRASNNTRSRVDIAKEVITTLISSTPSVDFGLSIFNSKGSGGRIIHRVKERDKPEKEQLVASINNLKIESSTNTPLLETVFESYLYYAGLNVKSGKTAKGSEPIRDMKAEDAGVYTSPFKTCQEKSYLVLMTDGDPSSPYALQKEIGSLIKRDNPNSNLKGIANSYMPVLTQWMFNNDINPKLAEEQNITTYTIGFGDITSDTDATDLLKKTAELGGGKYFPASNASALQKAFKKMIISILNETGSLSSPAIGSDSFDSTRNLNTLYYSSFLPSKNSLWIGNIKKLKINSEGMIVDRNKKTAINKTGNIKNHASTFWGGNKDGNNVEKGGIVAMFEAMQADQRHIYSNIGTNGTLLAPSIATLKTYYAANTDKKLGLPQESELIPTLKWLLGETKDANNKGLRKNIFADPLHSKPLVIPYVENGKQVVRFLVGNNSGFVHLFTDEGNTVKENWAFIPAELLSYAMQLKTKGSSEEHNYGMDLSPMLIKTYDSKKKLDKMIAVLGMRRGGSSYYALDVSNANNPKFLWKITPQSRGFSELGETWSIPQSGEIAYKKDGKTTIIPALFFGGGYDPQKDTCQRTKDNSCEDSQGRAIYIVNALTGKLIKSFEEDLCVADPAKNQSCMAHSFASKVSILDSDEDGYIDRIYAADTGGNVWRMDLKGSLPNLWSSFKFAQLADNNVLDDRRFFNAPVIVRSYKDMTHSTISPTQLAYDGLLIGSGDRTSPSTKVTTQDRFYFLQDFNVLPLMFEPKQKRPAPIENKNLYDLDLSVTKKSNTNLNHLNLENSPGWKYNFNIVGEKALGRGTLLDGNVYFTSYVPSALSTITCGVSNLGEGWLYSVNIHTGLNHFKTLKKGIGSRIPDDLVIYSGINDKGERVINLLGVGSGDKLISSSGGGKTSYSGTLRASTYKMYNKIYSFFAEP